MPAVDPDTGEITHVSAAVYLWMKSEIERLRSAVFRLEVELNHWYLRANYTPDEIQDMYYRASKGQDEHGNWCWPEEGTAA